MVVPPILVDDIIPHQLLPEWDVSKIPNEEANEEASPFEDPQGLPELPANLECQISEWVRPKELAALKRSKEEANSAGDANTSEAVDGSQNADTSGNTTETVGKDNETLEEKKDETKDTEDEDVVAPIEDKITYAVAKPIYVANTIVKMLPRKLVAASSDAAKLLASQLELVGNHSKLVKNGSFLWELIHPQLDENALPKLSNTGRYFVRLFVSGAWRCVEIDDRVPVDALGNCLFPVSMDAGEIWPLILAKALYKVAASQRATTIVNDATSPTVLRRLTGWVFEPYTLGPLQASIPVQLKATGYPDIDKIDSDASESTGQNDNEDSTNENKTRVPRLLCLLCTDSTNVNGVEVGCIYGVSMVKPKSIKIQGSINYAMWRHEIRRAFDTLSPVDGKKESVLQTELVDMLHEDDMQLALKAACLAKPGALNNLDISAQSEENNQASISWDEFIRMFDNLILIEESDIDVPFGDILQAFSPVTNLVFCHNAPNINVSEKKAEDDDTTETEIDTNTKTTNIVSTSFHWNWKSPTTDTVSAEGDDNQSTIIVKSGGKNNARLEDGYIRQGDGDASIEAESCIEEMYSPMLWVDGGITGSRVVINFETDATLKSNTDDEKHTGYILLMEEIKGSPWREQTKEQDGIFGSQRPCVPPKTYQVMCTRGDIAAMSFNVSPGEHFYRMSVDCSWGWNVTYFSDAPILLGPVTKVLKDVSGMNGTQFKSQYSLVENEDFVEESIVDGSNNSWRILGAQVFRVPEQSGTSVGATLHMSDPIWQQYVRLSIIDRDTGTKTSMGSLEMSIRNLPANSEGYCLVATYENSVKDLPGSKWRMSILSSDPLLDCVPVNFDKLKTVLGVYQPNKYKRFFRLRITSPTGDDEEETSFNQHLALRLSVSDPSIYVQLNVLMVLEENQSDQDDILPEHPVCKYVRSDGGVSDDFVVVSKRGKGSAELLYVPGFGPKGKEVLIQASFDAERFLVPSKWSSESPYWEKGGQDVDGGVEDSESSPISSIDELSWKLTMNSKIAVTATPCRKREDLFNNIRDLWEKNSPGRAENAKKHFDERNSNSNTETNTEINTEGSTEGNEDASPSSNMRPNIELKYIASNSAPDEVSVITVGEWNDVKASRKKQLEEMKEFWTQWDEQRVTNKQERFRILQSIIGGTDEDETASGILGDMNRSQKSYNAFLLDRFNTITKLSESPEIVPTESS